MAIFQTDPLADDNSLQNDKTSDEYNLKAFEEDKINMTENLKFVFGRVENIVRKKVITMQHFLLFPLSFISFTSKALLS